GPEARWIGGIHRNRVVIAPAAELRLAVQLFQYFVVNVVTGSTALEQEQRAEGGDAFHRLPGDGIATDKRIHAGAVAADDDRAVRVRRDGGKEQIQVRVRDGAGLEQRVIGGADAVPADGHAAIQFGVVDGINNS